MRELRTHVLVVGGGLGGVAATLAAAERGADVVLSEERRWLGGQLTSQAVPLDEHPWVEQFGVTARYRRLREGIRAYYRRHYPLTAQARAWRSLNPGASRNVGEAAGQLAALCASIGLPPRAVRTDASRLAAFQAELARVGVELHWPRVHAY